MLTFFVRFFIYANFTPEYNFFLSFFKFHKRVCLFIVLILWGKETLRLETELLEFFILIIWIILNFNSLLLLFMFKLFAFYSILETYEKVYRLKFELTINFYWLTQISFFRMQSSKILATFCFLLLSSFFSKFFVHLQICLFQNMAMNKCLHETRI